MRPVAIEGGCIVVHDKDFYIYGGRTDHVSTNALWKFDMGTREYTLLSKDAYNSPDPAAFGSCFVINNQLYVGFGLTEGLANFTSLHRYNFVTDLWSVESAKLISRDRNSALNVGETIYGIGGSSWNNYAHKDIYSTNVATRKQVTFQTKLKWNIYAMASVYYKDKFFIFGGGTGARDSSIHATITTDKFFSIALEGIPCSAGTYKVNGTC
ncbi:MAG: hypothetical protein V2I33_16690 [Kangiellaceae bacterium]|jgi:hypothetical protein|nr:hypothetical protein [Kangiellaceae bacterium]